MKYLSVAGTTAFYACHPHHRDRTPNKCKWTIPQPDEYNSFVNAYENDWIIDNRGWGLHPPSALPDYLGTSVDKLRRLFVACYVDGNSNDKWHGYPADHVNNNSDRLPESIKKMWLRDRVLSPAKIHKLAVGKPCSL